jgi:hypothetical protein
LKDKVFKLIILNSYFVLLLSCVFAQKLPPSLEEWAKEPIRYLGKEQSDKHYYHGAVPQAVGVHRYQVYRVNRSHPSEDSFN